MTVKISNAFPRFPLERQTPRWGGEFCGVRIVDQDGKLLKENIPPKITMKPIEFLSNMLKPTVEFGNGGISAFFYQASNYSGLQRFPKGYHDDTFLVIEQGGFDGIETMALPLYSRRLWGGAESGRVYTSIVEFAKISYTDYLFRKKLFLLGLKILSLHKVIDTQEGAILRSMLNEQMQTNFALELLKHKLKKLVGLVRGN